MKRNEGYYVDPTRSNYETSQEGLKQAGLIFATPEDSPPTYVWVDGILRKEDAIEHAPYQRFNKIPGMDYICYKSTLFKTLNEMQKLYPGVFDVYPKTFLLPKEFLDFQREHKSICGRSKQAPSWVVKPRNSCCGRGISIVQSVAEVQEIDYEAVIQQYIHPFLIDGHKFDFRFYVLIASLQPLSIFIYKEGIARFCTQLFEYPSRNNRHKKFMHLTNTAINIGNSKEPPSKFTKKASEVLADISKKYPHSNIWKDICEVCRAVIIGIYGATLNNLPKKCDEKTPAQKRFKYLLKNRKTLESKIMNIEEFGFTSQINYNEMPDKPSISSTQKPSSNSSQSQSKISSLNSIPTAGIMNDLSISHINVPSQPLIMTTLKPEKRSLSVSPDRGSGSQLKIAKPAPTLSLSKSNTDDKFILLQPNQSMSTDNTTTTETEVSENNEINEGGGENETAPKDGSQETIPGCKPSPKPTNPLPLRKRFFHILGIDIMIDADMKPRVLELNDRPSLGVTVDFEKDLKVGLISEAFEHVGPNGDWYGNSENSGWIQIYPLPRQTTTPSPYPDIINHFLNPHLMKSPDPQPIQFPKRSNGLEFRSVNKDKPKKKKKKPK